MSLTVRRLRELEAADFNFSPGELKGLKPEHRAAATLAKESMKDILHAFRDFARDNLCDAMKAIAQKYTGEEWPPQMEYGLWEAVKEGPEVISPEEVRKLQRLSDWADGWFYFPNEAQEPRFVRREEWNVLFDKHVEYTTQIRRG